MGDPVLPAGRNPPPKFVPSERGLAVILSPLTVLRAARAILSRNSASAVK